MRRVFCMIAAALVLVSLTACRADGNKPDAGNDVPSDHVSAPYSADSDLSETENDVLSGYLSACSKDGVAEFMSLLNNAESGGAFAGKGLDAEYCYNVTPPAVAAETDIKIFKFSDSCLSLALIDNQVYEICTSFGGAGFVAAVPWDYDEDGNPDLLIASSWGSGIHRSEISVFNTKTKESIVVYNTLSTDHPSDDLIVAAVSPALSSKDPADLPVSYQVYSVNMVFEGDNLADLSYTAMDVVGSVVVENGAPVFQPAEE